jgi:ERCC4-type nuclease
MSPFDVAETLKTFRIVADTREHNTPQAAERYKAFGCPVERATMNYGDYCGNITLPDGNSLLNIETTLQPVCFVERKMSLDELAGCFTRGRARFQREFERAQAAGAKMFLLVENGSWEAIQKHRYKSRFNPKAFQASLTAWSVRYGIVPIFCKADTSGSLIREFLYRDIKERLEGGEYG